MAALKLKDMLLDRRTKSIAIIVDVSKQPKGLLYTLDYGNGKFRRYYEHRLCTLFRRIDKSPVQNKPSKPVQTDFKNVVFVNFKYRTKFTSFTTWYNWVKTKVK